MLRGRLSFLVIFQALLFIVHAFVYATWAEFRGAADPRPVSGLAILFAILSISFVCASILAFRHSNSLVRVLYTLAAVWLGVVNYLLLAAFACWVLYAAARLAGFPVDRQALVVALFGVALLVSVYGIQNASRMRIKRITVRLTNLPDSWHGRTAALASDTHLGSVRGRWFAQRIAEQVRRLCPDVIFLPGDLYDGTAADVDLLAETFAQLGAPLGAYFVTGNHEEFSSRGKYIEALKRAGIRVLENEKVTIDGLQLVGVLHREAAMPEGFQSILRQAALDRSRASILLAHVPRHLAIAEAEGVSLQLSGHTHGGQFFPYTRIVRRIYGRFAHGLQRSENLAVYTSCGAGTWGPPMRVGTRPEIVLIQFE